MRKDQEPTSQDHESPFITMEEALKGQELLKAQEQRRRTTRTFLYSIMTIIGIGSVGFLLGINLGNCVARQDAVRLLGEQEFKIKRGQGLESLNYPVDQNTLLEWRNIKAS